LKVNQRGFFQIFNHFLRAETIAGLTIVDAVYINNFPTAVEIINLVKPDIYYKGPDYKNLRNDKSNNIVKEINATKQNGGVYKTANEIVFSSSKLINSEFNLYNKEQKKFLDIISKKYNFNYIYNKINELKNKRVLLIGETIIDQYIFGEIIGKSGKEPHLVMKKNIEEILLQKTKYTRKSQKDRKVTTFVP
jgi:bifunctional ADP-heptose synthase (sugar kinase/adenylyltransferase)